MAKYRIEQRNTRYLRGGRILYGGCFVQVLQEGSSTNKWVDIKRFGDREKAEELLEILKG